MVGLMKRLMKRLVMGGKFGGMGLGWNRVVR